MIRIVFLFFLSLTLLFLFLFIYKDRPRIYYSALAVILAVFIGGGSWILIQQEQHPDLVSPEQVIISNVRMETNGNKRFVDASITNISKDYKLTSITIRIDLTQCSSDDEASCLVVDQSEAIISAHIKPETTQDISKVFHFDPAIDQAGLQATLLVTDTLAQKHWD